MRGDLKIKDRIKKIEDSLDLTKKGVYVFQKWIFRSALILIFILFVLGWGLEGFGNPLEHNVYVRCDVGPCSNPLYECPAGTDFCFIDNAFNAENPYEFVYSDIVRAPVLPSGFEMGTKPNYIIRNAEMLGVFILTAAFILNHSLFNRRKIKTGDLKK